MQVKPSTSETPANKRLQMVFCFLLLEENSDSASNQLTVVATYRI